MALGVQGTFAGETIVTRGEFAAFATSSDPAITGHATMVRTADGKTIVTVSVRGLAASTTYGSHVHMRACADTFAGGHYKDDLAGPASPPNEIWPAFATNAGRRRERQRDRAMGGTPRGEVRRDPRTGRRQDRLRGPGLTRAPRSRTGRPRPPRPEPPRCQRWQRGCSGSRPGSTSSLPTARARSTSAGWRSP